MAVSKRLRYEILRRDNHTCRYCGGAAPDVTLTVDHVVPVALGGTDDPSNLVAACKDCNSGKSATPPGAPLVADVKQDALRWARAIEYVFERDRLDQEKREVMEEHILREFAYSWNYHLANAVVDEDYAESLMTMYDAGMVLDDWEEAMKVTARNNPREQWPYFCGTVWKIIRKRHQRARDYITSGEVT